MQVSYTKTIITTIVRRLVGRRHKITRAAQGAARLASVRRAVRADGTWVRILDDGTLEMRDPNDGQSSDPAAKSRYQYRYLDGRFEERCLPPESVGDAWRDIGVPEWEDRDPPESGPIWRYFEAVAL